MDLDSPLLKIPCSKEDCVNPASHINLKNEYTCCDHCIGIIGEVDQFVELKSLSMVNYHINGCKFLTNLLCYKLLISYSEGVFKTIR
jgi:hypothetical protein